MGRLIVSAVSNESHSVDVVGRLLVFVSVSRAADGQPVLGLSHENFRVVSAAGLIVDSQPALVSEVEWEAGSGEFSGFYRLSIVPSRSSGEESDPAPSWVPGENYAFGIQVRVFEAHEIDGQTVQIPVDFGQVVLQVTSLGT